MKFLEKDLEDIIFNSTAEQLRKCGLYTRGKMYRQLRIGNYGIADLVTIERTTEVITVEEEKAEDTWKYVNQRFIVTVYELKKDSIGIDAYLQAVNYATGIVSYINKRNTSEDIEVVVRIKLIGKTMDRGSFCYLPDIINNLSCFLYEFEIDGLRFKQKYGYKLIEEGFGYEN